MTLALNDGKCRWENIPILSLRHFIIFLGIRPDSVTSSSKCIFLIQISTLCLPGNLGSCQAPKPANDDETALLQSGRGIFPLLSPKVKPVTHPGGRGVRVTNRGIGPECSPAFGYIFIFENRKARNEGDRAERVGSGRSRCRERSRGDRGWVLRKSRESAAPRPFPPGKGSRTPPAGQGRRRRGWPGPLPERRARPRKQGGAAVRQSPRRGRPRGAEKAARRRPRSPPGRSPSPPPPPPLPVMGEPWARGPGGLGRTPRRTHRGRTAGGREPCEQSSGRSDRFLPNPTPPAAAAAAEAAAAATPAPESAAAAAPLPLRSPLPLRLEPRPCAASSLGDRGTGSPRPPKRGAARRRREQSGGQGCRGRGGARRGSGPGARRRRAWGELRKWRGERKKEVGGVQAGLRGL